MITGGELCSGGEHTNTPYRSVFVFVRFVRLSTPREHKRTLFAIVRHVRLTTEGNVLLQNRVVERFSRDERAAVKRAADIAQGRGKPETLQEHMDAVDTERAAEAARKRRPGSKTAADSSLAERFKPRCAVGQPTSRKTSPAQPAGTPARLLPADKRPPTRRGGRG